MNESATVRRRAYLICLKKGNIVQQICATGNRQGRNLMVECVNHIHKQCLVNSVKREQRFPKTGAFLKH